MTPMQERLGERYEQVAEFVRDTDGEWPWPGYKKRTLCSSDEFDAVLAELEGRPSWDDAPEWANYYGQNAFGEWEYYAKEPRPEHDYWSHNPSRGLRCCRGESIRPWQTTLMRRPESLQNSFEHCPRHVEDAKREDEEFAVVAANDDFFGGDNLDAGLLESCKVKLEVEQMRALVGNGECETIDDALWMLAIAGWRRES